MDELYSLYPGEWVLVEVTNQIQGRGITHGRVLAHSRRRNVVSRALLKAHQNNPDVLTYIFYGGPVARTDREQSEELAEATARWIRARSGQNV